MHPFTIVFLAALLLTVTLQFWLATRHIRHVHAHRNSVPEEFAAHIPLAAHQKAADYTGAKTRLGMVHSLAEALVLLGFTLGGGLQAIHEFWSGWLSNDLARGMVLIISTSIIMGIIDIPFSLYRTFGIEERFGFNKMSLPMFIVDLAKQAAIGAALGIPLLFGVLWLMARMGEYWWLYVWLAWIAFNLLVLAIYPTWIAPLFNKFTPLEDADLKARIERLLDKCGFKAQGLFVMDGSRRSSHGNAYFTGFGKTKRIVFFDTLLTRLSGPEIAAVLAHELGHFKRRHVIKRIAWTFAVSLALLWMLGYLMQQDWFYRGLNVSTPSTAMALLLFFLVGPVFTFLLHPLAALYSRKHEFEADRYAAENASATDLIRALVKLYQDNAATLTPDPIHSTFYDSHPPAAIRIARLQSAAQNQERALSAEF